MNEGGDVPRARRPARLLIPAVVFLATTLAFLGPALLGQRTYAAVDLLETGAPYRNAIERPAHVVSPLQTDQAETLPGPASFFRDLRHLKWQTWDQHIAAGTPTGILPVGGLLSPLSIGYLFFPAWYAVTLKVALGLLLAQWGTYLLLRRLRVGVVAAKLAGVAYAYAGTNIVLIHRVTAPLVFPLLLWAVLRLAERVDGKRMAAVAALVAWCWFEGFPSAFFYCFYAAVVFAVWAVISAVREDGRSVRETLVAAVRPLLAQATAFGLGVLLSAVSLVPLVVEILQRDALAHRPAANALPAIQQVGLFEPSALGRYPGDFWTGLNPVESASYVGLAVAFAAAIGLILVVAGRLRLDRARSASWTFFACAGGVMLLLCFRHPPVLFDVVARVPGIANNPIPRSRFILNLALVVLAAMTVDHWWRRDVDRGRGPHRALTAVILAVGLISIARVLPGWARVTHRHGQLHFVARSFAGNALLCAVAIVLAWAVARRRHAPVLVVVLAAVVFVQLAWPYRHFTPESPVADYYQMQPGQRELAQLLGGRFRFAATELRNFYPNSSQLLHLYDLRGQAIYPPAFKRLVEAGNPDAFRRDPLKILMNRTEWNLRSPVLDDLAVRYFAIGTDEMPFGIMATNDQRWDRLEAASSASGGAALVAPGPLVGAAVAIQPDEACTHARIGLALEAGTTTLDTVWRPGSDANGNFLPFALRGERLARGQPFRLSVVSDKASCRPRVGVLGAGAGERLATQLLTPDPSLPLRLVDTVQAWVYERTSAWSLISVHPRWKVYATQAQALDAVVHRAPGDDTASVVGDGVPTPPAAQGQATLGDTHFGDTDVRFSVTATAPVLVVVSQNVDRFWNATLDGHAVPIRSVDGALGGVVVPAGRHTMHLRYRPVHFYAGAGLSAVAVLVLVGLVVSDRVRGRGTEVEQEPAL